MPYAPQGCLFGATRALIRSTAEANGFRTFQLQAHDGLAAVIADETVRARHTRVAKALSRSLAANLPREDSKRFLERDWGDRTLTGLRLSGPRPPR